MRVWLARNPERTRIRLQFEPFVTDLPNWTIREGAMTKKDHARLLASTDDVEIEQIHQDVWAKAARELTPPERARGLFTARLRERRP